MHATFGVVVPARIERSPLPGVDVCRWCVRGEGVLIRWPEPAMWSVAAQVSSETEGASFSRIERRKGVSRYIEREKGGCCTNVAGGGGGR